MSNNFYVDNLDISKIFYIDSLLSIVYSGQVHKIQDGEDKRPKFIGLLKSIIPNVVDLSKKYRVDASEIKKRGLVYGSLVDELSQNTEDIDFVKLTSIFEPTDDATKADSKTK